MPRRTPLYEAHRELGARFVEFGGWEMPVLYTGATEEHQAVRAHCGVFDVSHMGEIEVRGPGAAAACQTLTVNDVRRLRPGDGQYTVLCNEQGGVLDDLIVFCLAPERYLLVVNAANTDADRVWITEHVGRQAAVVDRSPECVLVALQGPDACGALRALTALDVSAMKPFTILEGTVAGRHVLVSRTGYTGEDGFELLADAAEARSLWDAVVAAARHTGGGPAGLGARDTLRLEAALPLCGTDMDATTTPLEAGLGWVVKLGKGAFVGDAALRAQAEAGPPRRLVGLALDEPGIPRHGQPIWRDGAEVGCVTSGAKAPTLGRCIGMGYVAATMAAPGTTLEIEIRGRRLPARVVARPFYRRPAPREG